ncbi:MAG: hypothetical protein IJG32_07660 [Selenomonadaceae bacterium]|nr:hypothetical protein [Selenomonadaceae bacterium]
MHKLEIIIKTLSPCVLTSTSNATIMTGTHSAFSGSIIRGILASRFVTVQKLTDEAHDKTFREIFFGGLKFLPANPEIKNQRSIVLPLSLQSGKAGTPDGDKIQDLLGDEKSRRGYKSFRGFGVLDDGQIFRAQVKTNMFMHMSRSGDKERTAGRSVDGQIYNYEALDAGQIFRGEIIGDEKILRQLRDGLALDGEQMLAYVGRSKFTQYGKCLVTFKEIDELPAQIFGDKIFLRLDTPLIPAADCFLSAEKILAEEIVGKLGGKFSLGKVFASGVEVENFVVPWGMKRPRVSALAAGTVFELKLSAPLTDDDKKFLCAKIFEGFGLRTEEGFGQVRIWQPSSDFVKGAPDKEEIARPEKFSAETVTLAKKILTAHLLEQVRIDAYEDAKELHTQLKGGNYTHFFTRLGGILSSVGRKNVRENFKARLELEIRGGSRFEDHLKKFEMANGQKFFDVFTGNAEFPRKVHDLTNTSALEQVKGVINFSDEDFSEDEFLTEYLTNYFRSARKIAKSSGGDRNE